MAKFKDFLSALGIAPKTLDQAKATIEGAKPALDSVAALFSAAGLDLDAMLSAGPDSLKAHMDGLSANDALLAAAQLKVTELEGAATVNAAELSKAKLELADFTAQLLAVGFNAKDSKDIKADFAAHVAKESAIVLAKDGRPVVAHVNTASATETKMTRAAFVALDARKQLAFIQSGGLLTE